MTTKSTLADDVDALRASTPGPTVKPNSQDWVRLGGAVAFHLIERHAENWADAELMMDEFAASRVKAERERCATLASSMTKHMRRVRAGMNGVAMEECEIATEIRKEPK